MADKKKTMLQEAWRRVLRTGEVFEIKCASPSEARTMRFDLYNAMKVGKHKRLDDFDPELAEAKETCMISMRADDPCVVIVQPKTATRNMQALAAALGVLPEEVKSKEELEVADSAKRMMQQVGVIEEQNRTAPEQMSKADADAKLFGKRDRPAWEQAGASNFLMFSTQNEEEVDEEALAERLRKARDEGK